jgi:hypothetical protein
MQSSKAQYSDEQSLQAALVACLGVHNKHVCTWYYLSELDGVSTFESEWICSRQR